MLKNVTHNKVAFFCHIYAFWFSPLPTTCSKNHYLCTVFRKRGGVFNYAFIGLCVYWFMRG